MNILDAFYFMFTADTSGVTKGTEAGEASTKKLKKAIDDVDMSADKLAANFVNMAKNAAGALAGVLALGAIKALVNDTAAHTTAIALEARAMNMSIETMTAYQSSVIAMGGTAAQATATLEKLRDGFVEVSRFGTVGVSPMTMAFQSLGASAQTMHEAIKDPTIALSAIADNFAKLDRTQQIFLGQKLGLDQGTIMMLAQGRRSFDELIAKERELHAVTQEQADASLKYTIAQKELGMTFESVKRSIAQELMPAFTWVVQGLDRMITWLREHKSVAIATFAAIGVVVGAVLVPPLLVAAGALWALIAPVLAMAAPFVAVGIAIGLVLDDIEKFRAGQKSLIGEILQKWPMVGQIARSIAEIVQMSFKLVTDAIKWAAQTLVTEGVNAWNQYKGAFQPVIDLFDKGVSLIEKFWQWLSKLATVAAPKWLDKIGHWLSGVTGQKYDDVNTPLDLPKRQQQANADARAGQTTATGREISQKLQAMGWSREQAAGIAGNAMRESSGNAASENSIGMYGLFQWNHARQADFAKWAGHDIRGSSMDEQLQFFNYEVTKGKEQAAGAKIRAAMTPEDAALAAAHGYERYGNHPDEDAKRVAAARSIASGQMQMHDADTAPLAQAGAHAISSTTNVGGSKSVQVQIGDVHVHDAGNPQATAQVVIDTLKKHINNAVDLHDDGIAG